MKLAAVSQLEPTLRVNMLRNVAMAIEAMENELPKLEVTVLKLDDIIAKQRKARVSRYKTNESHYKTTTVSCNFSHWYQSVVSYSPHFKLRRSIFF